MWSACWRNCALTSMPRAQITRPKPFLNVRRLTDSESKLRLLETRRIIPRANCLHPSARMLMTERRFAVVRLGSLGDIVHTFPAVAAIRESFPAASIVWLTHPRWTGLVASSALATEIWPVDSRDLSSVRRVVAKLRDFYPDSAIDFQGLWKSAFPAFLAGVSR